jgi:hypothetical protein
MTVGTWVSKAYFYNGIHQAPGWFEKHRAQREASLFWRQHVLDPNVEMEKYDTSKRDGTPPPQLQPTKSMTEPSPESL